MTGSCAVAGRTSSAFEKHDRLLFAYPPGALEKTPTVFYTLDVKYHGARQGIHLESFKIILNRHHRFVARSAKSANSDALLFGKRQELNSHIAGLGHHGG